MGDGNRRILFDFYPRSPCGERRRRCYAAPPSCRHFYPRSPCGERQKAIEDKGKNTLISIHALLAESDLVTTHAGFYAPISIHALLAESDLLACCGMAATIYFYPRSPCGERRCTRCAAAFLRRFLSTLSLRRATRFGLVRVWNYIQFLSTLSLRRATGKSNKLAGLKLVFLSTLSLRRATVTVLGIQHRVGISIHALLAESDTS